MGLVEFGKEFIPSLVFFSHFLILFLIISLIVIAKKKRITVVEDYFSFFKEHAWLSAWIVVLTSVCGSLFYSEIAGYAPCLLCWVQRVLMYPLLCIIPLASLTSKYYIRILTLIISITGAVLALYHYGTQLVGSSASCAAFESAVDCAVKYTMFYGYISIPFMSLSAFLFIALLMWISRKE